MNNKKISVRYYLNTKLKKKILNGDSQEILYTPKNVIGDLYPIYVQVIYDKKTTRFATKCNLNRESVLYYGDEKTVENINQGKIDSPYKDNYEGYFNVDFIRDIIIHETNFFKKDKYSLKGLGKKISYYKSKFNGEIEDGINNSFDEYLKDILTYRQFLHMEDNFFGARDMLKYCKEIIPNFINTISKETKDALTAYWLLRIFPTEMTIYDWSVKDGRKQFADFLNKLDDKKLLVADTVINEMRKDFPFKKSNIKYYVEIVDSYTR